MNDAAAQPNPEMNVNQLPGSQQSQIDANQIVQADPVIDPVQARRNAEADLENAKALEEQHLASLAAQANAEQAGKIEDLELKNQLGLSDAKIASIAAGNPDPNAPQNPSSISPVKEMSLQELTQVVYALKAELDFLGQRFNQLAAENFRVKY